MFKRFIASVVCLIFSFSNLSYTHAQAVSQVEGDYRANQLPVPGSMISTTPAYVPLTLKGLIVHPGNALKFDFLMDIGHSHLKGDGLSDEALKIMKYFLTALTIPEDDLWVNLSPYEKNRIVQDNFGRTIMGRDLLAEDYVLKQLTASLIYPEKALGKEFWQQVYSKAAKVYGTTQIPVNTFNKVWIVPSEAVVWEHEGKVLIVKSHLKVMLEEDYLALSKHQGTLPSELGLNAKASLASQIVRNIVLPVLEKEVNEGRNFARLRQMYQAMILATWYKKVLKESIITKLYADQKKTAGIGYANSPDVEVIYQQYLKAFKKGAFNYIKEDIDPSTGQAVPRKYFSGGVILKIPGATDLATGVTVLKTARIPVYAARSTGDTIEATWQVAEAYGDIPSQDRAMVSELLIGIGVGILGYSRLSFILRKDKSSIKTMAVGFVMFVLPSLILLLVAEPFTVKDFLKDHHEFFSGFGEGFMAGVLTEIISSKISNYRQKQLKPKEQQDKAALAKTPDHPGGIALNAKMLDLQIKRDGNGVPLPTSQQPLDKINIQGFVPQIISIRFVDLPALLSLNF
jgi:hypothetical protein